MFNSQTVPWSHIYLSLLLMPAHAGPQCAAKMQSISETDAAATLGA